MATFERVCHGCATTFEAKSSQAKWCTPGCKKRVQRHPESAPDLTPHDGPDTGLVAEVRRELEAAGRVRTFAGQLALSLAQKVSAIDATGVSGLSKELRAVRAEALADLPGVPAAGAAPTEPVEDEVEKARRQRDEARKAAGFA